MKYTENLTIPYAKANYLEYLTENIDSDIPKDSAIFDYVVEFPDKRRMIIQLISPTEPDKESCWTQGVLVSQSGFELGCTDVGESFLGEYEITYDQCTYVVIVKSGTP